MSAKNPEPLSSDRRRYSNMQLGRVVVCRRASSGAGFLGCGGNGRLLAAGCIADEDSMHRFSPVPVLAHGVTGLQ